MGEVGFHRGMTMCALTKRVTGVTACHGSSDFQRLFNSVPG